MWWDEQNRAWKPHPDCTCGQPWGYCICPPFSLDPLDEKGKPIKGTIIENIREGLRVTTKKLREVK